MKILFVDDNTTIVQAAKIMLEHRGYSIDTAGSVASALDSLREKEYDVLISDIALPDGTAYDILSQSPQQIRSIALSGYTTDADRSAALAAGFTSFLAKPFKTDDIVAAIENHPLPPP